MATATQLYGSVGHLEAVSSRNHPAFSNLLRAHNMKVVVPRHPTEPWHSPTQHEEVTAEQGVAYSLANNLWNT